MNIIINFLFFFLVALSFNLQAGEPRTYSSHTHAGHHITTGNAHAKSGNFSKSLAELDKAISKDPSNSRAYKLRGHVYYAMKDYKRSLRDLDQVVSLVPDSANAYCDRAIAHSMVGNHGAALLDIEHALKMKPDSSFAQSARETILERAREH